MKALFFFSFFILCSSVSFAQIDKALLEQAEAGDSDAQYNVAFQYHVGINVEKNYTKAAEWYAKAAEKGHDYAMLNLADLYLNGYGVKKDRAKALELFLGSGNPEVQCGVARFFFRQKKYEDAFVLAEKSAKQGYIPVISLLARMYKDGIGVGKNINEAIKWYRKGAEQKDYFNMKALADLLYQEKQYQEAFKWYKIIVEEHGFEHDKLAKMYYNGEGCKINYQEAMRLFTILAEKIDNKSMNYLGVMYYKGLGCAVDYNKAFEWFKKSALWGNSTAQRNLGMCYKNGKGTEKDTVEAKKWLKQSEDTKSAILLFDQAKNYQYGSKGVKKDLSKAIELYESAAHMNHSVSCIVLGSIYMGSINKVSEDINDLKVALGWYEKAKEIGYVYPEVDKRIQNLKEIIADYEASENIASNQENSNESNQESVIDLELGTFDLNHTSYNGMPATLFMLPTNDPYSSSSSANSHKSSSHSSSANKVSKQADVTSKAYEAFKKDPTGSNARYYHSNRNLLNSMQKK